MTKSPVIKVNSNFHRIAGSSLTKGTSSRFREYRKKWDQWPKSLSTGDFPLFIDLEVTSSCNLRCPFCATTFRGRRIKKGFIAFKTVKKIVDQGADNGLFGIKFNIRGESLLHPQIDDFVRYAKKKGLIDVYFNTNAMLLTEEMSEKLIDAGLDRISISVEGFTPQMYEKHRVGANFDTLISNIESMRSTKKKLRVSHPKVRIQSVLVEDLRPIVNDYKNFWVKRADEVALLDYKQMKSKKKGIKYPWVCPQIWQRMGIFWDGTILPCNHDDDALLSLGNINSTSIKDAWHSEKMRQIRDLHRQGNAHKLSACDGCYLRDSEILKLKEEGEAGT